MNVQSTNYVSHGPLNLVPSAEEPQSSTNNSRYSVQDNFNRLRNPALTIVESQLPIDDNIHSSTQEVQCSVNERMSISRVLNPKNG